MSTDNITYRGFNISVEQNSDCSDDPLQWDNLGKMVFVRRDYSLGHELDNDIREMNYLLWLCPSHNITEEEQEWLDYWNPDPWNRDEQGPGVEAWDLATAELKYWELSDKIVDRNLVHMGLTISYGYSDRLHIYESGFDWEHHEGLLYCTLADAQKNWCIEGDEDRALGWDYQLDEWWDSKNKRLLKQEDIPPEDRVKVSLRDVTRRLLKGEAETYGHYLSGEVYGYIVNSLNDEGESLDDHIDSCWGYYGDDHEASGLLEAARSAVDCHISYQRKKVFDRLKAETRHRVPLHKRQPFPLELAF
jgi:hypothetical protein